MAKCVVLLLTAVTAATLAGLLPDEAQATLWFQSNGLLFIALTVAIWLFCELRVYASRCRAGLRRHWGAMVLALVLTGLAFAVSPPKFRFLADESDLAGVSMLMAKHGVASLPLMTTFRTAGVEEYVTVVDKRPLLFPFAVSLVHLATGYRPENSFVVNLLALALVLFGTYLLAGRLWGRLLGVLAMLLVVACPALVIWSTSGGFETLNLAFVILAFIAFDDFTRQRNAATAELLIATLVILAQCRYESALFGVLLLFAGRKLLTRDILTRLSAAALLLPVGFVPWLWQRSAVANEKMQVDFLFESRGIGTITQAFSLESLLAHTPLNAYTLSGLEPFYGFSFVLFALFVVGASLLIVRLRSLPAPTRSLLVAAIVCEALAFVVVSAYFWGDFSDPSTNRLSLVFVPGLVLPATFALQLLLTTHRARILVVLAFVLQIAWLWPHAHAGGLAPQLFLPRMYDNGLTLLRKHYADPRSVLLVSSNANLYLIHGYAATNYANATLELESLRTAGRPPAKVVLLQLCLGPSGVRRPMPNNQLSKAWRLTEVETIQLDPLFELRLVEAAPNL